MCICFVKVKHSTSSQVKKGAWTEEEDRLIFFWHGKLGNSWAAIAQHLPGR